MRHTSCPQEVEWRPITFRPLMKIMTSIELSHTNTLIVPNHLLLEEDIRQQNVKIYFAEGVSYTELNDIIDESGIPVDSIDYYERIIFGSSIFKMKSRKGYWCLKAPCIYCYGDIARNSNISNDVLLRSVIRAYL